MIKYKKKRTPDVQYRKALQRIIRKGVSLPSQQEYDALTVFGYQMRFDLRNGFPMISERDVYNGKYSIFYQAIGELMAFLNGARTQKELESYGCRWWSPWVTEQKCKKRGLETGDIGPGSYGPAWTSFPTSEGGGFNQIKHNVLEQIKELPHLRTHMVSSWIPQYIGRGKGKQQKVTVVPCHGFFHVRVFESQNKLSLHHFQRSADAPVGLAANLIQYAALTLMLAQVLGYRAWELVYTISDMHMYVSDDCEKSQMMDVINMIGAHPQPFPKVYLDPKVTDLFEFRQEHFKVEEYHPQAERKRIWTPV